MRAVGPLRLALGCAFATAMMAHPAAASPYRITGLDAADSWEVKLIGKYAEKRDEERLWTSEIDVTAPLAPGLETSLTVGRGWLHEAGAARRSGMTDAEWAIKWEAVPIDDQRSFGLTVEPALILPTGTNGLGDGEFRAALPVILGWQAGPLRLRGLIGYEHSLESDDDELSGGVVVEYKLAPRLSVGGEYTTRMPSRAISDHKDIVDVGFKYELREGWELQGRLGQTVRTKDHVRSRDAALYLEIAL